MKARTYSFKTVFSLEKTVHIIVLIENQKNIVCFDILINLIYFKNNISITKFKYNGDVIKQVCGCFLFYIYFELLKTGTKKEKKC
jgi:hypothetical protein